MAHANQLVTCWENESTLSSLVDGQEVGEWRFLHLAVSRGEEDEVLLRLLFQLLADRQNRDDNFVWLESVEHISDVRALRLPTRLRSFPRLDAVNPAIHPTVMLVAFIDFEWLVGEYQNPVLAEA